MSVFYSNHTITHDLNLFYSTVPIGYSDLGFSGRAAYSDLITNDGPPPVHLKRKAQKITEGPIFGVILSEKEQPVAAAI